MPLVANRKETDNDTPRDSWRPAACWRPCCCRRPPSPPQGARGTPTPGRRRRRGRSWHRDTGTGHHRARSVETLHRLRRQGPLEKQANAMTPENPLPRRAIPWRQRVYPQAALGTVWPFGTFTLKVDARSHLAASARPVDRVPHASRAHPRLNGTVLLKAGFQKVGGGRGEVNGLRTRRPAPRSRFHSGQVRPRRRKHIVWHDPAPPTSRVAAAAGARPVGSAATSTRSNGAIRVGGNIAAPKKIKDVAPVYPPIAQSARVSAVSSSSRGWIGADGQVMRRHGSCSIPLLDQAALDAVRQWEFTPVLLNGAPTRSSCR